MAPIRAAGGLREQRRHMNWFLFSCGSPDGVIFSAPTALHFNLAIASLELSGVRARVSSMILLKSD